MTNFYEIVDPRDGDVIQRLLVLTRKEIARLESRGYIIRRQSFSRAVWDWLLDDGEATP